MMRMRASSKSHALGVWRRRTPSTPTWTLHQPVLKVPSAHKHVSSFTSLASYNRRRCLDENGMSNNLSWMHVGRHRQHYGTTTRRPKVTGVAHLLELRDQGDWQQVLQLMEDMDNEGETLDATVYTLALETCFQEGQLDVVMGLFENMMQDAILPDDDMVETLMESFVECNGWNNALSLVNVIQEQGRPLSLKTFRTALAACNYSSSKGGEDLRRLLQNAFSASDLINLKMSDYANIMMACGQCQRVDLIQMVFNHMDGRQMEPDEEVCAAAIRAFTVNDATTPALHLLGSLEAHVRLGDDVYTDILEHCVRKKKYWAAIELYERLLEGGGKPCARDHANAMVSHLYSNQVEDAQRIWKRFEQEDYVESSGFVYHELISACFFTENYELSSKVYDYVEDNRVNLQNRTFSIVIRALGRMNRVDRAISVYEDVIANTQDVQPTVFLAALNAAAFSNDTGLVTRIWEEMQDAVVDLKGPAYASAVNAFAGLGDADNVAKLLKLTDEIHMDDKSRCFIYASAITGFKRINAIEEVRQVLQRMLDRGVPFCDGCITSGMDLFIHNRCFDDMDRFFDTMLFNVLLEYPAGVFGHVLSSLAAQKDWKHFKAWYQFCEEKSIVPKVKNRPTILAELLQSPLDTSSIAYSLALSVMNYGRVNETNGQGVSCAMQNCYEARRYNLSWALWCTLSKRGNPNRMAHKYAILASLQTKNHENALTISETLFNQLFFPAGQSKQGPLDTVAEVVDVELLSAMLVTFARHGMSRKCVRLWTEMQSQGWTPSSYAIHAMLKICRQEGHYDVVLAIRDLILKEEAAQLTLNESTSSILTSSLLRSLATCKGIKNQAHVLRETWRLLKLHVQPCPVVGIDAFDAARDYEMVLQVLENAFDQSLTRKQLDEFKMNQGLMNRLETFCLQRKENFVRLLDIKFEMDVPISTQEWSSILARFEKNQWNPIEHHEVLQRAVEANAQTFMALPVKSWKHLIQAYARCNGASNIVSLFRHMSPSDEQYLTIMECCRQVHAYDVGRAFFLMYQQQRQQQPVASLERNVMMEACGLYMYMKLKEDGKARLLIHDLVKEAKNMDRMKVILGRHSKKKSDSDDFVSSLTAYMHSLGYPKDASSPSRDLFGDQSSAKPHEHIETTTARQTFG